MTGRDEDRGVSEVIGFIIIFSFLVIAFTIYQGIVVPDQNRGVEFEHNQAVQGQLQELRNALLTSATTGSPQAVSVRLGAKYPDRTLARNLGATAGSITGAPADGAGEIRITNATAQGGHGEVRDVWNGSVHSFESTSIVYRPTYSFYTNGPLTYLDNVMVANRFANANLTVTDQALVDDERLTLISVVGGLSEAGGGTASVELEAASAATNTIAVRNETSPVTITLPTYLSADTWNESLWDEHVDNPDTDGHVVDVRDGGPGEVEIVLEPGVSYELRLARVGIGSGVDSEDAHYLALVERPDRTIGANGSHFITVEARDRFNNPVTGAEVTATIEGNGTFANGQDERTVSTSVGGRATVNYTASDALGSERVRFEIEDGDEPRERVWVNMSVGEGAGGSGGGGDGTTTINPSSDQKSIVYVNSTLGGQGSETVDLHLNNTLNNVTDLDEARFQFYFFTGEAGRSGPPADLTIDSSSPSIPYLGPFTEVNGVTLQPGINTVTLEFSEPGGGAYEIREGDFAILTIRTEETGAITYYIGMTS